VYAQDCETPLADALIQVRHANEDGIYGRRSSGNIITVSSGNYELTTIMPSGYDDIGPHIHFMIGHPEARSVRTSLYFTEGLLTLSVPDTVPSVVIELKFEEGPEGIRLSGTFPIVLPAP
jgi:protocatechuate 3,4-dioxygenase beta subunit